MTFALLIGSASASSVNKIMKGDDHKEGCSSDENVREEIAGVSPDGKDFLVKRVTIHTQDLKNSKPQATSGSGCYKLMNGIRWTSPNIPYVINPINSGMDTLNVTSSLSTSTGTWDASTSRNLFGTYTVDTTRGYGRDGYNTILFGSLSNNGIIAQTTTWYYRYSKQIVEFDMLLNTYYSWGDAKIEPTKMDLQNIATHEIGHGIGLADLYNSCTGETMYGYSSWGETKKRDLNAGDIAGLQKLYGY